MEQVSTKKCCISYFFTCVSIWFYCYHQNMNVILWFESQKHVVAESLMGMEANARSGK